MRIIKILIIAVILTMGIHTEAWAYTEIAKYTAPNGFQVVSYSKTWNNQQSLKEIYQELLLNTHGEEMKLLSAIYIYPAASTEGSEFLGHWYGLWRIEKGKYRLLGNRYINLYHGETITDVEGFARTLAHEYGHHFTYYYYFQTENRSWEQWRSSTYAKTRGIDKNYFVGYGADYKHAWQIEEIAADDYVQLFGSPTTKQSQPFGDIEERAKRSGGSDTIYSNATYNFTPQENSMLAPVANTIAVRNYWLKAMGKNQTTSINLPSQPQLEFKEVKDLGISTKQYIFTWFHNNQSSVVDLEDTLVRTKYLENYGDYVAAPVKTVIGQSQSEAKYGAARYGLRLFWEEVPETIQYFTVYSKNKDGFILSSNTLAIDFKQPNNPDYVSITPAEMNSGQYFKPRVKFNGKQLIFDVDPEIINGRTMIPIRKICDELGAEIFWDENARSVNIKKDETDIMLFIDNTMAMVNEEERILDVAAVVKSGRTLVPLRFVSQALGAEVEWNDGLKLVSITQN